MANRLFIFVLPLLALATPHAHAQNPSNAAPKLSVDVRVVAIDAVVRDSRDKLISNLSKEDFTLREDGKPVPIRYFSRDEDLPLTVGLLVDTSISQRDFSEDERSASATFLQSMITRPADRAFVERFDTLAVLLQPMTSDIRALAASLNLLTAPLPAPEHSKAGTLLYDAICATAEKVVSRAHGRSKESGRSKQSGRSAIVILTDGDDDGSTNTPEAAIRAAQTADLAIYSVLYTPEARGSSTGVSASGIRIMRQISNATGGSLFIVTPGVPIAEIFHSIAEDLRSQYRLGFTPTLSAPGTFHTLDLKPRSPFLIVHARTGYYTPPASAFGVLPH